MLCEKIKATTAVYIVYHVWGVVHTRFLLINGIRITGASLFTMHYVVGTFKTILQPSIYHTTEGYVNY